MKFTTLSAVALSFAATASALPSSKVERASCNKPIPNNITPGQSSDLTIDSESGHSPRKYRLRLPKDYDGTDNLPLIIAFHGRGKTGASQQTLSRFTTYGFEGITVYPEGVPLRKDGSLQQWQGDPNSTAINDVKFTLELLDELEKTYCVDSSRIYAAGKSNGAGFTAAYLACDAEVTKRIAAFAPVSAALYEDKNGSLPACNPSRKPLPLSEFHGWVDDTIPYLGGPNTRGNANSTNVKNWVDDWAKRDGYKVEDAKVSYLCSSTDKNVTRYSWNETLVHYNYTNVGHQWMSASLNGDIPAGEEDNLTCEEAEATPLILKWFKTFTL